MKKKKEVQKIIYIYFFYIKCILIFGKLQGKTFSRAPGVLFQVCGGSGTDFQFLYLNFCKNKSKDKAKPIPKINLN